MVFRSFALAGACALALTCGPAASAPSAEPSETLSHGLFDKLLVFKPEGAVRSVVLLLSGLDGVTAIDRQRARAMATTGAMVAVADTARFYTRLEAEGGRCTYPNGAFENLGRHLQAYYHLPGYQAPMLVGRADGGTLAYAMLAQAAPGTFASALSLGFCPRLPLKLPMCEANALKLAPAEGAAGSSLRSGGTLAAPWVVLSPPQDAACATDAQTFVDATPPARRVALGAAPSAAFEAAFHAAHAQLVAHTAPPQTAPPSLAGLPIVEVPVTATASAASPPLFAVLLSGDGGWAGIDKDLAAALAKRNVPVAGFDSLRYFWSARTPEGLAADLDRLIRYYASHWGRAEVLLIGYSQGADVLPFALNRLPAGTRAKVKLTALLGPGQKASFEFHVTNWIGKSGDRPIAPEAMRLAAADVLCVHGSKERESLCPQLAPQHAQVLQITGDHHFDGDYDKLAQTILDAALRR